jgi:excisionase family DNA binding protein
LTLGGIIKVLFIFWLIIVKIKQIMPEIKPNGVYTTEETQELLKISNSTIKRLLKKGLIRANKVGGQYRILGHEILRMLSPEVDEKVSGVYGNFKRKVIEKVKDW